MTAIVVPPRLVALQEKFRGAAGLAWAAALPAQAAAYLDRWELRLDGAPMHGMCALVLPVVRADGTPAVLKLNPIDWDHPGEGAALRTWNSVGAVRLLEEDPDTWTLLLERLDSGRSLLDVADDLHAVEVIGGLLVRLNASAAPPGVGSLASVSARMLENVPSAAPSLADAGERRLLHRLAAALREVAGEPGDRLLHWDLHYENVLAGERERWLAIDPKPLSGDPGFELLPALHNRWDEMVASGDVARAVCRRFDLLVEMLGLDRDRAVAWSLGRVLQNALWEIEDGGSRLDPIQVRIAAAISR